MYSDPFDKKAFIMLLQPLGDVSVPSVSSLTVFFLAKKKHQTPLYAFKILRYNSTGTTASPNHVGTCSPTGSTSHPIGRCHHSWVPCRAWAGWRASTTEPSVCGVREEAEGITFLGSVLIAKGAAQKAVGLALWPSRARGKPKPFSLRFFFFFACGFIKVRMPPAGGISSDTHLPFFPLHLPHHLVHALLSALPLARPFPEMP